MKFILLLPFTVAFFLYLWFNTSAFVEYCNIFRISLFKLKMYNESVEGGNDWTYLEFLKNLYFDKFFVRLLWCPFCTATWISFILTLIYAVLVKNTAYISVFPYGVVSGYTLYRIIDKL